MKISKQAFLSILRFFLSCPLNLKATKQFFTCFKVSFWRVQAHINMRMMCLPDQAVVQSLVRIDQWSVYYPGWRKKRLDVKFKTKSLITFITNKIVTVATTRGSSKIFTVSLVLRNHALCKPLGCLRALSVQFNEQIEQHCIQPKNIFLLNHFSVFDACRPVNVLLESVGV